MTSRSNYWSCSKFADWLRGTAKPYALEWEAWDTWHEEAAAARPRRYWIAETLLNWFQNIVYWPNDKYWDIRYYLRNRYITKTHYLPTRLQPGQWYDLDTRILHGLFESLVDFVEVELSCRCWDDPDKSYRSIARGLRYLDWEESLVYNESCGVNPGDELYGKPTDQATKAVKTRQIYLWWKSRGNRPDPYDLIHEEFEDYEGRYGDVNCMEAEHEAEDTAMLIELINHRHNLWT